MLLQAVRDELVRQRDEGRDLSCQVPGMRSRKQPERDAVGATQTLRNGTQRRYAMSARTI